MKYTARTDVGRKRENNEDNLYAKIYDENTALFVVADGLGGYASGEIASKMAVSSISNNFDTNLKSLQKSSEDSIKKFLKNLVQIANEKIYSAQMANTKYKGMGTTIVIVAKINGILYYESVGDSRLYYIDKEALSIEQVTYDDTFVNELLKKNIIKKSDAAVHPQKHVLTKALGIFNKIDAKVETLKRNDGYLILCSDGLTNMVSNEDMLQIVKSNKFERLADVFIDTANSNGGVDNITVVVAQI